MTDVFSGPAGPPTRASTGAAGGLSPAERALRRGHALGQGSMSLLGLGVGLIALRSVGIHAPACPLRTVTGIPCPGCGMTRLADAVARGRLEAALHADGAGVAILVAIAIVGFVHLATVVRAGREPVAWMRSWALPAAIGALALVHWVTTIIGGGLPSS